jgi:adenosylcobinamide-phosphate synthase
MRLEYQILAAAILDLVIGDPRWFPHPVKIIGRFALALENPLRRAIRSKRLAGAAAALIVIGATGFITYAIIYCARRAHPLAGDVAAILVIYTTMAARDLMKHGMNVYRALREDNIEEARGRVAMMVGRDTDRLDEQGVARAAVESIAENMVDGITAPLFFAIVAGPVGAMVYKAINTLDSTFGYKNERYLEFGYLSAKVDDLANFIPARLTAPLVPVAAAIVGLRPLESLRIFMRDRANHPSPNGGLAESAVAGALGVRLGGASYYFGRPSEKPTMGDPNAVLTKARIPETIRLTTVTALFFAAALIGLRAAVLHFGSG